MPRIDSSATLPLRLTIASTFHLVALVGACSSTSNDDLAGEPTAVTEPPHDDAMGPSSPAAEDGEGEDAGGPDGGPDPLRPPAPWERGSFRYLPERTGNLLTFVTGLEHPNAGGFGKVTAQRTERFNLFFAALNRAVDDALNDEFSADYCRVMELATAAGYSVERFYDTPSQRWFIYGADTTQFGQAYFFINPGAKRNLVIESPHSPFDANTAIQGARIFRALSARAFLLNKEHRCSDPDPTDCDGTTGACGGFYRESDVAHHRDNTFHGMHRFYSDLAPDVRFAQLHGYANTNDSMAEISDTSTVNDPNSVANRFADHLKKYVPVPAAVFSCQRGATPRGLCARTNVQGRYTNAANQNECTQRANRSSGRFLHIEQGATLRDADDGDGWFWGDIRDALQDTWPECTRPGGSTDCTLGPPLERHPACACGAPCR